MFLRFPFLLFVIFTTSFHQSSTNRHADFEGFGEASGLEPQCAEPECNEPVGLPDPDTGKAMCEAGHVTQTTDTVKKTSETEPT